VTAMDVAGRRVVMTGACGSIGRAVGPTLARRWDLRLTDVAPDCDDRLDVADIDACRSAFSGADAIVHLAAVPDPDASWDALREPNVVGAYNVCRAAAECGARRLVLASSLQAVSGDPDGRQRRVGDPPRPANLYGATKAWSEALGAWTAATSRTSVVALRIGYFAASSPLGTDVGPRDLGAWLSHRDCAELIRAAVEAGDLSFVIANGISANRYPTAELDETRRSLGYAPLDDAWASG
jgi:nucleoside-diphosphate-sugar epimerase